MIFSTQKHNLESELGAEVWKSNERVNLPTNRIAIILSYGIRAIQLIDQHRTIG